MTNFNVVIYLVCCIYETFIHTPAGSVPEPSAARPESAAAHPAAVECWPRSSWSSAQAGLSGAAWHLTGWRTALLTIKEQ